MPLATTTNSCRCLDIDGSIRSDNWTRFTGSQNQNKVYENTILKLIERGTLKESFLRVMAVVREQKHSLARRGRPKSTFFFIGKKCDQEGFLIANEWIKLYEDGPYCTLKIISRGTRVKLARFSTNDEEYQEFLDANADSFKKENMLMSEEEESSPLLAQSAAESFIETEEIQESTEIVRSVDRIVATRSTRGQTESTDFDVVIEVLAGHQNLINENTNHILRRIDTMATLHDRRYDALANKMADFSTILKFLVEKSTHHSTGTVQIEESLEERINREKAIIPIQQRQKMAVMLLS